MGSGLRDFGQPIAGVPDGRIVVLRIPTRLAQRHDDDTIDAIEEQVSRGCARHLGRRRQIA
jgi:hypothetical protein